MLHGYGSNGNDLISLAQDMAKDMPDTIFYAPNAPDVIDANGYKWFDIDEIAESLAESGIVDSFIANYLPHLTLEVDSVNLSLGRRMLGGLEINLIAVKAVDSGHIPFA